MKINLSILATSACALWLAIPLAAASAPAAKTTKIATKAAASLNAWPPETLSGKIVMVDPDHKLVVVKTPGGVPFDMDITGRTRITSGDKPVALKDLTREMNKQVSVKFVPERRGDVARAIQIGS